MADAPPAQKCLLRAPSLPSACPHAQTKDGESVPGCSPAPSPGSLPAEGMDAEGQISAFRGIQDFLPLSCHNITGLEAGVGHRG